MDVPAYEPAQIARLYGLTRAAGWEVFFMTKRPPSAGDSVQFQTQWWIERFGFYLPAVMTVPGSRGDIANGLRLDLVVDDQMINCVEVIGAGADEGGADAARAGRGGARRSRSTAASASSRRCQRRSPCSSDCTTSFRRSAAG